MEFCSFNSISWQGMITKPCKIRLNIFKLVIILKQFVQVEKRNQSTLHFYYFRLNIWWIWSFRYSFAMNMYVDELLNICMQLSNLATIMFALQII